MWVVRRLCWIEIGIHNARSRPWSKGWFVCIEEHVSQVLIAALYKYLVARGLLIRCPIDLRRLGMTWRTKK